MDKKEILKVLDNMKEYINDIDNFSSIKDINITINWLNNDIDYIINILNK